MVGDHPVPNVVLVVTAAVAAGRVFGDLVDDRPHQVGFIDVVDALQQARDALHAQTGVDVLTRQRAEDLEVVLAGAVSALVLHEDEVPDFDVAVLVGLRTALDAVFRAPVVVDLRARTARAGNAHRPVVVGHTAALDALGRQAGDLLPQPDGLVVVVIDGGPEPFGVEPVAALGDRIGQQRPGEFDGPALEVVAEGEVAGHLEEGVVPGGDTDLVDVRGPDALLDAGRRGVRRGALPQEVGHELDHARVDEQQVGVIEDHRGAGHLGVSCVDEVVGEPLPDLVGLHGSGLSLCVFRDRSDLLLGDRYFTGLAGNAIAPISRGCPG